MNKKGWHDVLSWISLPLGLVLIALGLIPLMQTFNLITWGLPVFLSGLIGSFVPFIISIVAIYLIIEAFLEDITDAMGIITAVVSLIVLALGIIVILGSFGVIGFTIPFLSMTLYNALFIILGILAIIAAFIMF